MNLEGIVRGSILVTGILKYIFDGSVYKMNRQILNSMLHLWVISGISDRPLDKFINAFKLCSTMEFIFLNFLIDTFSDKNDEGFNIGIRELFSPTLSNVWRLLCLTGMRSNTFNRHVSSIFENNPTFVSLRRKSVRLVRMSVFASQLRFTFWNQIKLNRLLG